jgi:DNA polymerase IV
LSPRAIQRAPIEDGEGALPPSGQVAGGMIVFLRVPGFYAAVEQADHGEYRGRPVLVGGDPEKGALVVSASEEARQASVVEGMLLADALKLCPGAVLRPTRLPRYREVAAELRAVLRNTAPRLEPVGLDGAYLDPPPGAPPIETAGELCVEVRAELGLGAVAGVGRSRFVAWQAAHHARPEGLRQVSPAQTRDFLGELPVTEIWGLGPAAAERLAQHGIAKLAQLQECDVELLEPIVGLRNALLFLELARGEDGTRLRAQAPVKSLSRELTLETPCADLRALGETLGELATQLEAMLVRERRAARSATLALVYADGERITRAATRDLPLLGAADIRELAAELLARTQAGLRPVRRLRLQLSKLGRRETAPTARQLRLF